MHPIERLRYVARARGADAESLVVETAGALRGLGLDPAGLVVACRRIVERHPSCGPLWWLCCRVLTSPDPAAALRRAVDEVRGDATPDRLVDALPEDATIVTIGYPALTADVLRRRGDVRVLAVEADHLTSSFVQRLERVDVDCELVPTHAAAVAAAAADVAIVEAEATSTELVVAAVGSAVLAAAARLGGTPTWLVAGRGRRLPAAVAAEIAGRLGMNADPFAPDVEVLPATAVTHVVGPDGWSTAGPPALAPECELASELLRATPG